ncbi:arylsulfatase [Shimia sagamensis]|uniref:Arylsulfatase n=1 Tax=Shimia sagamensis TaxID=1566352 RepID=A0ABY1PM26_9RHOB|nr:arylsulfatase [Shimia sagamensis]SMP34818.1 arylsulfatase [Shimia sagamensis]
MKHLVSACVVGLLSTPVLSEERPNVLLIVADDLGFSDLGVTGAAIQTPIIDGLASEGVLFTEFHAAPNCSPSRGAMLTGVSSHKAGMGGNDGAIADNQNGLPAYRGHLGENVVTIGEVLRDAGYHTSMAGKWHLGHDERNLPSGRGFEKSFALINGAASHWADQIPIIPGSETTYMENDVVVETLPSDFYSSAYYTDKVIGFVDEAVASQKPFFTFLSFTAPHNPLHAPDANIQMYKGQFDAGWDQLSSKRLQRQKELGLIANGIPESERPSWVSSWASLTEDQKAHRARDMEIYAGMITFMDHSIGRLLTHLKKTGQYDNTLILFLSDNGPSKTSILDYASLGSEAAEFVDSFDNSLENKGRPGSSTDIGPGWAYASATPLRLFKGYVSQGGIRVPAIIKAPNQKLDVSKKTDVPVHIMDVMPTILDFTGASYPGASAVQGVSELQGRSLHTLLTIGDDDGFSARPMAWEAYGMDALRQGDWKILRLPQPYGNGTWQLYNVSQDPGETIDLAAKFPNQVEELSRHWQRYAAENGVVHPDGRLFYAADPGVGKF